MFRELEVPEICERLLGSSVPQEDRVLVISYEGTHVVHLGATITVETDDAFAEYDIYDSDVGTAGATTRSSGCTTARRCWTVRWASGSSWT